MLTMSYVAAGGTPEQFAAYLAAQRVKIGTIIRTAGIKVEQ
jgi:tripartite-type tricarboxylate transporter receptor subunit TctC